MPWKQEFSPPPPLYTLANTKVYGRDHQAASSPDLGVAGVRVGGRRDREVLACSWTAVYSHREVLACSWTAVYSHREVLGCSWTAVYSHRAVLACSWTAVYSHREVLAISWSALTLQLQSCLAPLHDELSAVAATAVAVEVSAAKVRADCLPGRALRRIRWRGYPAGLYHDATISVSPLLFTSCRIMAWHASRSFCSGVSVSSVATTEYYVLFFDFNAHHIASHPRSISSRIHTVVLAPRYCSEEDYEAGEAIFSPGDEADSFYVVTDGQVIHSQTILV